MAIISWIIMGAIAGWIASIFSGDNARMGFIANTVVGIIGGLIGGGIMSFFGGAGITGFNPYSFGVAVAGSVLVLWLAKKIFG